jgi:hypothetical protein
MQHACPAVGRGRSGASSYSWIQLSKSAILLQCPWIRREGTRRCREVGGSAAKPPHPARRGAGLAFRYARELRRSRDLNMASRDLQRERLTSPCDAPTFPRLRCNSSGDGRRSSSHPPTSRRVSGTVTRRFSYLRLCRQTSVRDELSSIPDELISSFGAPISSRDPEAPARRPPIRVAFSSATEKRSSSRHEGSSSRLKKRLFRRKPGPS